MIRRLSLAFLLAVLSLGVFASAAVAKPRAPQAPAVTLTSPLTRGSEYLALGDSVTFGYQEPTTVPAPNYQDAASFLGYPEQLAKQLHVKVTNLACPGETSGSLINVHNPTYACENTYRKAFPLHVRYSGSQLSTAVSFLRHHSGVRLVSLMIGANDYFLCQTTTSDHCAAPAEQEAVFAGISRNVRKILTAIRRQARYTGQLAIVSYYSTSYTSAAGEAQSLEFNKAMDAAAKPFHVIYANGYAEFQAASVKYGNQPCLAGLITQLDSTVGDCGIHPTYSGQALLAAALAQAIRL